MTTFTTVVDGDLEAIAGAIWSTLFELALEPASGWTAGTGAMVTGVVRVDGAWHGAVVLRGPLSLATTLASSMFRSEAGDQDQVGDAWGELTNMMAGNVKALLPEPCRISLPVVGFAPDDALALPGAVPVATAIFTYAGHGFVVALVRLEPEGVG